MKPCVHTLGGDGCSAECVHYAFHLRGSRWGTRITEPSGLLCAPMDVGPHHLTPSAQETFLGVLEARNEQR